jgi:crotonobetainyl-CoA:carnitine CoA-transferase CaiB-like acyl-CoA transferase
VSANRVAAARLPLDDLLVVEVGEAIAPAYAGKLLAEVGATVIRIDPPAGGRLYRSAPLAGRDHAGLGVSAAYLHLNRGKKSAGLDLGTGPGREALGRLVAGADVLIDGLGVGRLSECGHPHNALLARHPRLVVTAITPFGLTGPYRDLAASDLVVLALGGLLNMVGFPDRAPLQLGGAQAQYATGVSAFTATMAALLYRDGSGRGQLIDVSLVETVAFTEWKSGAYFDSDGRLRRRGSESQWMVLPARDGFIGFVYQDADWPAVQRFTQLPALRDERFATRGGRIAHARELREILTPWFSARTKVQIYHEGQAQGIPLGFVATIADLLASEQYAAHGFWQTVDHPDLGPATYPGIPYRAGWAAPPPVRAPAPGEHTREVLGAWAGYSEGEKEMDT